MVAALAVIAALEPIAGASPLADALARHGDADIAALRSRNDEPAARCTLGAIYARRNELPRAALWLTDCEHAALPDDVGAAVRRTARDVKRQLDASGYAPLDIITHPDGLSAEVDALPGESFTTPATIWVAPGAHDVTATFGEQSWHQTIVTEARKKAVLVLETRLGARPAPPSSRAVDLTKDDPGGGLGEVHTGPPPDASHPPMLSARYRGVPDETAEPGIADPFAAPAAPAAERDLWLGARLGGGAFGDGIAATRAGLALAVAARYRVNPRAFVAARADWSQRGGSAMTGAINVLGASAGGGLTVLGGGASQAPALAVIGQVRADLRLTGHRDGEAVPRAGLGLAAGLELALPATPFSVGVRLEQGVTELVPGARDRAILAELGLDLR